MQERIKFTCPHCRKKISALMHHSGKATNCPGCNEPILVPDVSEQQPNVTFAEIPQQTRETHREKTATAPSSSKVHGITLMFAFALLFGIIGYILRPAHPSYGQLPFSAVIQAGQGSIDETFQLIAQQSFAYTVLGAVIGAAIGVVTCYIKENLPTWTHSRTATHT